MGMFRRSLAVGLAVLLVAPAAHAQQAQHVVSKGALEQAVKDRMAEQQADRDAIHSLLRRADVRMIAAHAGLSLEKAEAAVATLQGEELKELASHARQVQNDMAGGASAVVISTTTIIIVLLLVILIIAIAD